MHASRVVFAASLATALFATAAPAAEQTQAKFPSKSVRMVVGFSPGSATDITARNIAPKLAELWGQSVIVDNRSGGGSTVANAVVSKAMPDGHTLLVVSSSFAITAVLQKSLPYDALRDFRGVTQIGTPTSVVSVTPQLGPKSLEELIALAQKQPGRLFYGSAGTGSGLHMTTERLNLLAGMKVVHVPFRGQPEMLVDLLAGRIQYGILSLGVALPFLKEGRIVPLAVVNPKRSPLLPSVPAVAEILPGYERDAAHALIAPARTPDAIVKQISLDVARVLDMPDVKERFASIAFELAPTTPDEYDRIIRKQMEIFARVAKQAGIQVN
jgi:tripartite-type tricarboxylate transporter receptor subunit TctC